MAGLTSLSRLAAAVGGAGLLGSAAVTPASPTLSAAQRDSLDRGDLVVIVEPRPASAWPAVTVYSFIEATPEEAAAVFTDYERHATHIPAVTKARISRVIDRATVEVDYTLAVPLLPDEHYTVRDHVSRAGPDGYRVDWTLVRASSTKATTGHALFTPWLNQRTKRPGTLLEYYNFVTPGSRLAGLPFIRSRSIQQIGETARAIAREAEMQRGRESDMRRRLTALRNAVTP
jgi:hypothetical protein